MKTKFLSILAMSFIALTSQAQVLQDAVMLIKLNETSSSATPVESVGGQKCRAINNRTIGEAVNNDEMGWVRDFQNRKNGIATKLAPVYGSAARTYSFWAYTDMRGLSNDGTKEIIQNNTQAFTTGSMDRSMGGFFMQIVQGKRIRIGINDKYSHVIMFDGIGVDLRDSWHLFTVTIPEGGSAADAKCYIDGIDCGKSKTCDEKGNLIDNFTLNTVRTVLNIGPQFSGMLSNVTLFDKALSQDEVKTLMKETRK